MEEKRIRMMTKLADYEEKNKACYQIAENYYRSDYMGICLLKNILRITVVYLIGFAFWACYSMESILKKLNTMDIKQMVVRIVVSYVMITLLFLIITYVISAVRYYRSEKNLQIYRGMLARLSQENETDGRSNKRSTRRDTRTRHRNRGGTSNDGTYRI